jgi:hypothetical protein
MRILTGKIKAKLQAASAVWNKEPELIRKENEDA